MRQINYIRCPNCGWVGDSDFTQELIESVLNTRELNASSTQEYGFSGSSAECPACHFDLAAERMFAPSAEFLVADNEMEYCDLCTGAGGFVTDKDQDFPETKCPKCFGDRLIPSEMNKTRQILIPDGLVIPQGWIDALSSNDT